jgi:hypothetical protein
MSEVNAAARVLRVQGSSFQKKMCLGSPKNTIALKKRLFIAIKKKGTRAPWKRCVVGALKKAILGFSHYRHFTHTRSRQFFSLFHIFAGMTI